MDEPTGFENYMILPRKSRAPVGYVFRKGWERFKPWILEFPGGTIPLPPEGVGANEGRVNFVMVQLPDEDTTFAISLTCQLPGKLGRGAVRTVTVDVGSARSRPGGGGGDPQPGVTTTAAPEHKEEPEHEVVLFKGVYSIINPDAVDADHYSANVGISYEAELAYTGGGDPPAALQDFPDEWKKKYEADWKASSPVWDTWKNGGEFKMKEYSDFWSHFTWVEGAGEKKKGDPEAEIKATVATYEVGQLQFGAKDKAPAYTATLSVSLAEVNTAEVWKTAFGIATGRLDCNIFQIEIKDGDYKSTGTVKVGGEVKLKAVTLEEIVEKVAEQPEIIAGVAIAAVILAVGIVMLWVENEIELVDEAEQMPPRIAKAYRDGVNAGFSTGPEHDVDQWSDGSRFNLTPYFQQGKKAGEDALKNAANATAEQKQAAKDRAYAGALEWAKQATWQDYKSKGHPADLTNEVHQRLFGTPDPDYKAPSKEGGA